MVSGFVDAAPQENIMLFNSLVFLVFAPTVLLIYFAAKGRIRLLFLLAASYFFYGWWDWRFLSLILASTIIDYFIGRWLESARSGHRKLLLVASCVTNLGLLAVFKYFNFFVTPLIEALTTLGVQTNLGTLNIILPVGISFYTFQTMSYTIDRYRQAIPVERDFIRFATFVAFFPQLVAGPIVRAGLLLPQLREDQPFRWENLAKGLGLVLWGYFLKLCIADSLAGVVDARFRAPLFHNALSLQIGLLFYAFQIYGDFAGYSSIAIGIARIMGFDFGRNFDRPYFSASFTEFWSRWHISLSSWLRDYLYIPLGGNRKGKKRTHVNLMLTMLLGGLWHGPRWTFVAWGGLHGIYLIIQRMLSRPFAQFCETLRIPAFLIRCFLVLMVFALTCLGWLFFRAQNFGDAMVMLGRMIACQDMQFSAVPTKFQVIKGVFLIGSLWTLELLSFRIKFLSILTRRPMLGAIAGAAILWAIAFFGTFNANAFIYFQF
jgi:D-alanyl-lipoteichoic acid acyltransferase DltB (MBOAT superfamily)